MSGNFWGGRRRTRGPFPSAMSGNFLGRNFLLLEN
jgi:hypothetical protein